MRTERAPAPALGKARPAAPAPRWTAALSASDYHQATVLAQAFIPAALTDDWFRPLAAGDRGEAVGRRHEPVPRLAAGRDDGVVPFPDAMVELVLAQVLPHV